MTAPVTGSSAPQPDGGLRPGVLKVRHAVITALAVITPAAAILFLPIPIGANAGAAMPLSIVVAFAVVLVIMNAVYRFALGRDGLLPRALGRTLRRFGTPVTALTVLLAGSIALGLGFGLGFQPLPAFSLLSLIVTLCALGVYAIAQFGLAVYFWRLGEFNPFWHGLVPAAAVAAIVYLFIKNVSPKPPYPADLAIWISIGWLVAGILAMFGLMIFKPGRLSEAAAIIGEGDTPQERGLLDA